MTGQEPTRVVLLTPPGRGAVASLLVEGHQATQCVATLLQLAGNKPLDERPHGQIAVGRWGGPQGEEVVVARRGENRVEIHVHGGAAASARVISDLTRLGCSASAWDECLADEEVNPLAAAARRALAESRTERTAAILLDQYAGALRVAVEKILASVQAAHREDAQRQLEQVLKYAALGQHLTTPWRVVFAGPPNVGKSSLINAMIGFTRAIVHATPGTTRDVVTAATVFDGWPVELADTAGLRTSADPIEAAGVCSARQQLATADCVVLVFDGTIPWTTDDQRLVDSTPNAIVVHNKSDLPNRTMVGRPDGLVTSAIRREGLDALEQRILTQLVPAVPPPGTAVPFTDVQAGSLQRALEGIGLGRVSDAVEILTRMSAKLPGF